MNKIIPFLTTWLSRSGDDTFWSWVITLAYFATMVTSLLYASKIKNRRSEHFLWMCISLFIVVMGFNKQLDIQILIAMSGRFIAWHLGLMPYRALIYSLVVVFLFITMTASGVFVLQKVRGTAGRSIPALSGVSLLMIFVLLRAASVHVPKIHGLELLGLLLIISDLARGFYKLGKTAEAGIF